MQIQDIRNKIKELRLDPNPNSQTKQFDIGTERFFLKKTDNCNQKEFLVLKKLNETFKSDQYGVPNTVLYENNTLVTQFIEGNNLFNIFYNSLKAKQNLDMLNVFAFNAGTFLKNFHSTDFNNIPNTDSSIINNLRDKGGKLFPKAVQIAEHLFEEIDYTILQHNDFCPSNILVNGGNIYTLDYSNARYGPIEEDLMRFYLQIEWLKCIFNEESVSNIQKNFLEGYNTVIDLNNNAVKFYICYWTINDYVATDYLLKNGFAKSKDMIEYYDKSKDYMLSFLDKHILNK